MHGIMSFFRQPTPQALAQRELEDTRRLMFESIKARMYYEKLTEFYEGRIDLLQEQLRHPID